MKRRSKICIAVLIVCLAAVVPLYWSASYIAGDGYLPSLPPFCYSYPPGGNCHADYSYSFTVTVNYSGSWSLEYYGFHNGEVQGPNSSSYYLSSTSNRGQGNYEKTVALSGDNFYFLWLCAKAQKLDSSNSTLTLTIDVWSNSTSLPYGSTYRCGGVAP
jgi:hypothetical protein